MRNLKKVIALVAVFAMMVSTVAFAQTFTDVDDEHSYAEAIEMLSKLEILTGDDQDADGKMDFRPEDTITRAEVAAIISRIQNIDSTAQRDTEFVDVPASHWASGYVAQAAGQGIVNGYGDGNFGPEDPVLYEQVIKMLMVTLGYEPFAVDNGGYPTGYLTAASRWGVTEGLIGAGVGEVATRGQVAQMVYKAIDTPLMDRNVYGDTKEYIVYDGGSYYGRSYDYMSLLTRDLHVKKFSGVVVANEVTDYTQPVTIDTDEKATVTVKTDDNDNFYRYDIVDIASVSAAGDNAIVYVGEEDVNDLLGKHVNVFVKQVDGRQQYEVISMAPTSTNKVAEFTLDQFDKYAVETSGAYVYYFQKGARYSTPLKLEATTLDAVIYNGVAYDSAAASYAFAAENVTSGSIVNCDSKYSGKVTLIDNDSTNGYDVAVIDVATSAVVKDVTAGGRVEFYNNSVKTSVDNQTIKLEFDEEDTNQIINLTKDGVAMDWTELKEWDVISILWNSRSNYYDVQVIDSTKVESSVAQAKASDTSFGGYQYSIDGNWYDVAVNAYKADQIKVGVTGVFYIDAYGKIVAYDKTGTGMAAGDYGFILGAAKNDNLLGVNTVDLLILDKTGEIYHAAVAAKATIVNDPTSTFTGALNDKYEFKNYQDAGNDGQLLIDFAAGIVGNLVNYDSNSSGEVTELIFAYTADSDEDEAFFRSATFGSGIADEYDEDDAEIKLAGGRGSYEVTEDTVVFFINDGSNTVDVSGNKLTGTFSRTASKVGNGLSLATGTYNVAVYDGQDDVAGAIVVYNTVGGVSPSNNLAVIESVGSAWVDDERLTAVSYYLDGELKTAVQSSDNDGDDLAGAQPGDMWKFALSADGSTIEYAEQYTDFERYYRGATVDLGGERGQVYTSKNTNNGFDTPAATDMEFHFGPVVEYNSSKNSVKIATGTVGDQKDIQAEDDKYTSGDPDSDNEDIMMYAWTWNLASTTSFKAEAETNVYVVDPSVKGGSVTVGTLSDVNVDEDLVDVARTTAVNKKADDSELVADDELALGMLDFVAAVEYDGDVLDIVIYKAYNFGRYYVAD